MRRLGHRPSDKELMAMLAEVDEVILLRRYFPLKIDLFNIYVYIMKFIMWDNCEDTSPY